MFSQLFLDYLCTQNVLTEQQAHDVAEQRKVAKMHIGTLALNSGLMTPGQIETVVKLQSSMDMRFGEIAIMKGYITQEQFSEILNMQPKEHMYLSQVLTDWGLMNFDQFIEHASSMQAQYDLDYEQFERLINNEPEAYIDMIAKIGNRYGFFKEYALMFLKAVTRLIDRDVLVEKSYETTSLEYGCMAYQPCENGNTVYTCFSPDAAGVIEFAQRYVKMPLIDKADFAYDAVAEFLNSVNGMLITKLSDEHIAELEIDVPILTSSGTVQAEKPFCVLPFRLPFGEFSIFALDKNPAHR